MWTLSVSVTGTGTVHTSPGTDLTCSTNCSTSYSDGTLVNLTATPGTGYTFSGWSGNPDCTDGTVTMNAAKTCTAIFELAPPLANFTWRTDAATDYKVLFDGSSSTCPAGAICSYSWTFGDGATGLGQTISHVYIDTTTRTATLMVTSSSGSSSISKPVTPVGTTPTSLGAGLTVTPNGFSPSVTWTVSGGVAPYTIYVNWGDNANSSTPQASAGAGSASHTYLSSGIYTVTVIAKDSGVNGVNITTATAAISVTIAPVSVSGLVTTSTGTPLSGVSLSLQLAGVTKKITTSAADGTYSFTNVAPGCYTVVASKSGYTFANPVASFCVDGSNVTGVNIAANPPATVISVSGTVYKKDGITPLSGVSLSMKLGGVTKYLASTDASGNYTFKPVAAGSYTVTATKSGYTFASPAASVTVGSSSVTGLNFNATGP
jgi:PKD repeat protein